MRSKRWNQVILSPVVLRVYVPFPPGARVTVFVVGGSADICDDLLWAAQSSLDFWDNPFDDEDWNNAG